MGAPPGFERDRDQDLSDRQYLLRSGYWVPGRIAALLPLCQRVWSVAGNTVITLSRCCENCHHLIFLSYVVALAPNKVSKRYVHPTSIHDRGHGLESPPAPGRRGSGSVRAGGQFDHTVAGKYGHPDNCSGRPP